MPIIRESGTRNHVSPYGRRRFFPNRELNAYTRFFHIKKPGHAGLLRLLSFKADIVFYLFQLASHPIQLHINSRKDYRPASRNGSTLITLAKVPFKAASMVF